MTFCLWWVMDDLIKVEKNKIQDAKVNHYNLLERDRLKSRFFAFTNYPIINNVNLSFLEAQRLIAMDFIVRFERLMGKNVLFPMGFNNFDLSIIENSGKLGHQIAYFTQNYLPTYQKQINCLEVSYNHERTFKYSNKNFQKLIQDIFTKLYQLGLIVRKVDYLVYDKKQVYQKHQYYELNGEFYNKEHLGLQSIKKPIFVLKVSDFKQNLLLEIKRVSPKLLEVLGYSEGLSIDFYTTNHNIITLDLPHPEVLFGISYVILNPNHFDIKPYLDENEYQGRSDQLAYSGIDIVNHFSNHKIPIFIGDYFDEAIHVGIPSDNEVDEIISSQYGLSYLPIYDYLNEQKILVNSRFLNGYTKEEAREFIIRLFKENGNGRHYEKFDFEEIVLSSPFNFGIPIPITYDGVAINKQVIYDLRQEGRFADGVLVDKDMVKDFINPYFIECFMPYLARVLDEVGIDQNADFEKIDYMLLSDSDSEKICQYVLGNLLINMLDFCQDFAINHVELISDKKLANSSVKLSDILDKYGSSILRISILLFENISEKELNEAKLIVNDIRDVISFKIDENGLDTDYNLLKKQLKHYALTYNFKDYFIALYEFIKKVHKVRSIPYVQLKNIIIYLSIITPALAEDLKERLLKINTPLIYCSFPE